MVTKRSVKLILTGIALFSVLCFFLLSLFLPLPKRVNGESEEYACNFGGESAKLSYAEALRYYHAADETGATFLFEGKTGRIDFSENYRTSYLVLSGGDALALFSLRVSGLSRLEQAVLFSAFSDTLYYLDGAFSFNGERVVKSARKSAGTVTLLAGTLPIDYLSETGAYTLNLRKEAEFSASRFRGSCVENVTCEAPYHFEEGAVYLDTAGGRRLVASLPNVKELTVSSADFIDEGALSSSTQIEELTLPFVGSAKKGAKNSDFGFVFGKKDGYYIIPESLKKVRITGGRILADTFYAENEIEELDLRGAEEIEAGAFSGLPCLKKVTANTQLSLPDSFQMRYDGECYVYTRTKISQNPA